MHMHDTLCTPVCMIYKNKSNSWLTSMGGRSYPTQSTNYSTVTHKCTYHKFDLIQQQLIIGQECSVTACLVHFYIWHTGRGRAFSSRSFNLIHGLQQTEGTGVSVCLFSTATQPFRCHRKDDYQQRTEEDVSDRNGHQSYFYPQKYQCITLSVFLIYNSNIVEIVVDGNYIDHE